LPFVKPYHAYELGIKHAEARRSDSVAACQAVDALSAWDDYAPDVSALLQLYKVDPKRAYLSAWTNNFESAGFSFSRYLSLAQFTCSKTGVAQRAVTAALDAPKPDPAVIAATTESFKADPLGTIDAYAAQFAHTRLSSTLLINATAEGAPQELLDRLAAVVPPTTPLTPPSAIGADPSKARVRNSAVELAPALLALAFVSYGKGENILVSLVGFLAVCRLLTLMEKNCHEVQHAGKPDERLGRLVYDYSNLRDGTPHNGTPEEGDVLRAQLIEKYGEMNLPSFTRFVEHYWDALELFPGEPIYIAKTDIRRAYHLQRWTAAGSLQMAVRLTEDVVMIPITWGFGSREAPYAYNPVSQYFDWLHSKRMQALDIPRPLASTFVDDMVTIGPKQFLEVEVAAHEAALQRDLHPGAVNVAKRSIATRDDVLGVRMDATAASAGLSHKAYLKLLYVFFVCLPRTLVQTTTVPLHTVQCMASLAYCYGKLFPLLRHTASVFYKALKGQHQQPTSARHFTNRQIASIALWRDFLFAAHSHASIVSSPLNDVYYNDPVIGGKVYMAGGLEVYSDASELALGGYIADLGWFEIKVEDLLAAAGLPPDTKIHIAYLEMIALIVVYLFAVALQPDIKHVHVHVDNQNAQGWATGHIKTDNDIANNCVCVNSYMQVSLAVLQTRSYLPTLENVNADAISRLIFRERSTLQEYQLGRPLLAFLCDLVTTRDSSVWPKRLRQLMPQGSVASSLFSRV
jgi:hypothetical protein